MISLNEKIAVNPGHVSVAVLEFNEEENNGALHLTIGDNVQTIKYNDGVKLLLAYFEIIGDNARYQGLVNRIKAAQAPVEEEEKIVSLPVEDVPIVQDETPAPIARDYEETKKVNIQLEVE